MADLSSFLSDDDDDEVLRVERCRRLGGRFSVSVCLRRQRKEKKQGHEIAVKTTRVQNGGKLPPHYEANRKSAGLTASRRVSNLQKKELAVETKPVVFRSLC